MDETRTRTTAMAGKTCLVTGATSGIGEVAASELARLGARVVLVGRDRGRCRGDRRTHQEGDRQPRRRVDARRPLVAGRSPPAGRRGQAPVPPARRPREQRRGHVLDPPRERRRDRDDLRAQPPGVLPAHEPAARPVQGLGPVPGRQRGVGRAQDGRRRASTSTTSRAVRVTTAGGPTPSRSSPTSCSPPSWPAASKGSGVTANCAAPRLRRHQLRPGQRLDQPSHQVDRPGLRDSTGRRGPKTTVYLASSPEVEGISGKYFYKSRPALPSPFARDPEAARRLWRMSEEMTGLAPARA